MHPVQVSERSRRIKKRHLRRCTGSGLEHETTAQSATWRTQMVCSELEKFGDWSFRTDKSHQQRDRCTVADDGWKVDSGQT